MNPNTVASNSLLKQVRRIEIRARKLVNESLSGRYFSAFKGRGMSFDHVRQYQPGDDPKTIDWNIAARTGELFTKQFVEERELTLMLMVDASASQFFGARNQTKDELAAELAALFAFSAVCNQDKVGLIVFSDQVELFLPPRKGAKAALRIVRELLNFKPKSRKTNIAKALEFLVRAVPKHTVCFCISDFLQEKDYKNPLRLCALKHDFTAVRITDSLECNFDFSAKILWQDLENDTLSFLDLSTQEKQKALNQNLKDQHTAWKRWMIKNNVDVIDIFSGQPYLSQILAFFKRRGRIKK